MQKQQAFCDFILSYKVSIFVKALQNKANSTLLRLKTMVSFGKKIAALRKEHKMSQTDLAKQLNTSVSVISRYERDEMTPSIDVAKKLATILNTTVGYLLGETDQENVLKDPEMLKRLSDIEKMQPIEKDHVLFTLDAMIQKIKLKNIAAL